MKFDYKKAKDLINDYFNEVYLPKIRISKKYDSLNSYLSSGLDDFGEMLVAAMVNGVLPGGSGMGYDVIKKIPFKDPISFEVKTCSWAQPNECSNKSCGFRVPKWRTDCVECGSLFKIKKQDSRFGINAKKFVMEHDDYYFLVFLESETHEKIQLNAYYFDKHNKYFKDYANNQYKNSKKSNSLNLVPNSFDFYMIQPVHIFEAKINLLNNKYIVSPLNLIEKKIKKIPTNKLTKAEQGLLDGLIIKDFMVIDDIVKAGIWLREKKLNKSRGPIKKTKIVKRT